MKKLLDFDEFTQRIPKNREFRSLESQRVRIIGYVTQEEFVDMQTELKEQLEEQTKVLEEALLELKQVKLHLASMSEETIEPEDAEE